MGKVELFTRTLGMYLKANLKSTKSMEMLNSHYQLEKYSQGGTDITMKRMLTQTMVLGDEHVFQKKSY